MLYVLVIGLILASAGLLMKEGAQGAAVVLVATIFSGLIAFTTFEPIAALIERSVPAIGAYADAIVILAIFSLCVTGLRLAAEHLSPVMVKLPGMVHQIGGALIGAFNGWILAGIFLCVFQTLPLHQNFWGYQYRNLEKGNAFNPDRYWLAYVDHASRVIFDRSPAHPFDPAADYLYRYHHYRRYDDSGKIETVGGSPGDQETTRPTRSRRGASPRRI
ncbi:Colicin V production protein [Planctomycetes bacterium Pan216]|uniref:Colicin V production protein n=1 Tax=Kolteria novifilia TaxID=2527975 RepID=A0A518AYU1_9BACT|nr:Colicin V production protein [Planctomycetes bacterium Pan216]